MLIATADFHDLGLSLRCLGLEMSRLDTTNSSDGDSRLGATDVQTVSAVRLKFETASVTVKSRPSSAAAVQTCIAHLICHVCRFSGREDCFD